MLDFIFFRIEILFAASFARHVFAQFIGRAIDAVIRAQRSGQSQPGNEGRAATKLEMFGQDIRSVRPQIGPEIFAEVRCRSAPQNIPLAQAASFAT